MAEKPLPVLFRWLSAVIGIVVVLVGGLELLSCLLRSSGMIPERIPLIGMPPVMGFCSLLAGSSLCLQNSQAPRQPLLRLLARGLALLVSAIGLLVLSKYVLAGILGPGWFAPMGYAVEFDGFLQLQPARSTALVLTLIGLGLFCLDQESPQGLRPAEYLALAAALLPFVVIVASAYSVVNIMVEPPLTAMAVDTAMVLVMLAAGILLARPDHGLMSVIAGDSPGGSVSRRLLPAFVAIPLVLGWLRLLGENMGLYNANFGLAFMVAAMAILAGSLSWVNAIAINRTEAERRRSESLEQQQQLESLRQADILKDQFLSILSHELRTPINAISGFANILKGEVAGPINERQQRYLRKILRAADTLLSLVNDLLDMSQIQAGRFSIAPRLMRLEDAVRETLANLTFQIEKKRHAVENAIKAPLPEIEADPKRVGQILNNLLGNAIKFTPDGGTIRIGAAVEADRLRCEITDSGPGIADKDVAKLFGRFMQIDMTSSRKEGGAGLGLSISKALIEAHGGTIGVNSIVGKGSTFWFTLPLRKAAKLDFAAKM
ncbi:MAG: HAMP domain-containing histidine kinase [Cyanobacteria bacterium NC_groundwater_1444_Ag_S-0.65um_54_12]|nr:HAMP domain-containing histidine kinase [Cyanobacteria bacterium NC_groundwater_1444_Ag_S-0.65um_54_12]